MRGRALAAQTNVEAIVDQISQFNFYQGGGLDLAFLSFAEVDAAGNVNVSKFGSRLPGCGGFIDISQNAKQVVFCGLFGQGRRRPHRERRASRSSSRGRVTKFRKRVEHVTFSGARAAAAGKPVRYVTERAVFGLGRAWGRAPGDRPRVRPRSGTCWPSMEFRPVDLARPQADGPGDLRAAAPRAPRRWSAGGATRG